MALTRRTILRGFGVSVGSLAGARSAPITQARATQPFEHDATTIIGGTATLYRAIPDTQRERFAGVWETSQTILKTANELLATIPGIENVAALDKYAEAIIGVTRNITENIATAYDVTIDTRYLDAAVRAAGYLPLLAQTWELVQAAQAVQEATPTRDAFVQQNPVIPAAEAAVERFYVAIVMLLTEIVFAASGVGYTTAFGLTRRAANVGLVHLRRRIGLRAYSIVLSIVHWAVRGGTEETISRIVEKTTTISQEMDAVAVPQVSTKKIESHLPTTAVTDSSIVKRISGFVGRHQSTTQTITPEIQSVVITRYAGQGILTLTDEQGENCWLLC